MPSAYRLYEAFGFAPGPAHLFVDQPGALTMSLELRAA